MNLIMDNKTRNIINLTHSICSSFLSYNYILNPVISIKKILFFTSHSFFLYDTMNILDEHYLDILHHILSCFTLISFYIGYYEKILIQLFFFAEISNVAIFGHYHIIKTIENENIVLFSSIIEFLWYTYFRVFCMTQILIDNYDLILFTPLSVLLIIYYMSIDWSYTLFNNLYNNLKIKYFIDKKI